VKMTRAVRNITHPMLNMSTDVWSANHNRQTIGRPATRQRPNIESRTTGLSLSLSFYLSVCLCLFYGRPARFHWATS
jgi:hypothetical protein